MAEKLKTIVDRLLTGLLGDAEHAEHDRPALMLDLLSDWLPYSIARTWHVQLGIFWIATAWLATGLYIGPAVSGVEPKFQRLGVNVLLPRCWSSSSARSQASGSA